MNIHCARVCVGSLLWALLALGAGACGPDALEGDLAGEDPGAWYEEDEQGKPKVQGDAFVEGHTVHALWSNGEVALLSSVSLVPGVPGLLTAFRSPTQIDWQVVGHRLAFVGRDGNFYLHDGEWLTALNSRGEQVAFSAKTLGNVVEHPWGGFISFGEPRGEDGAAIMVLDHQGHPLWEALRAPAVQRVHAVAAAPDGRIYAAVTRAEDPTQPVVMALSPQLEPIWQWKGEAVAGTSVGMELAADDEMVVLSLLGQKLTYAFTPQGDYMWGVTAAGGLLIDQEHVTYIGGARRTAVNRDGEILWDLGYTSRMSLIDGGLAAMTVTANRINTLAPVMAKIDKRTGELIAGSVTWWPPADNMLPPVVVGGRLVGASDVVVISHNTDYTSQYAQVSVGSGARALAAPRPPLTAPATTHTEETLLGMWAAVKDGRARVVEFRRDAPEFGLRDGLFYGLWDYAVDQPPRLVQVGRWALQGANLALTPVEDLTGGRGRTALQIRATALNTLSIDDPLQPVVRPFGRVGALPDLARQVPSKTALWMDDNRGELYSYNNTSAEYFRPAPDGGAWVVARVDFTGSIGGRNFRRAVAVPPGKPAGDLNFHVFARLDARHEYTHFFSDEASRLDIRGLRADGEALHVLGQLRFHEDPAVYLRVTLAPGADGALQVAEKVAWPEPVAPKPGEQAAMAMLADRGVVTSAPAEVYETHEPDAAVLRLGASGAQRWRLNLGRGARVLGLAVDETIGAVYVVGTFSQQLQAAAGALDAPGEARFFVGRVDLETGTLAHARALGPTGALNVVPEAQVGVIEGVGFNVLLPTPFGHPWTVGAIRVAPNARDNAEAVYALTNFDRDLNARWGHGIHGNGVTNLHVHPTSGASTIGYQFNGVMAPDKVEVDDALPAPWEFNSKTLRFSACGDFLPGLRVNGEITEVQVFDAGAEGIFLSGKTQTDLFEHPYYLPFLGNPGSVQSADPGNFNPVLLQMKPDAGFEGNPDSCGAASRAVEVRVTLSGHGGGRVVSEPAGIDCPGECRAMFDGGEPVRLRAEPGAGQGFAGFLVSAGAQHGCSPLGVTCDVVPDEGTEVDARFEPVVLQWDAPVPLEQISDMALVATDSGVAIQAMWQQPMDLPGGQVAPGRGWVNFDLDGHLQGVRESPLTSIMDTGLLALRPDGLVAARQQDRVSVFSKTNELLWEQALPIIRAGYNYVDRAFFWGDRLVVIWGALGEVNFSGLDPVQVDVGATLLAVFDARDGTPRGVHKLWEGWEGNGRAKLIAQGSDAFVIQRVELVAGAARNHYYRLDAQANLLEEVTHPRTDEEMARRVTGVEEFFDGRIDPNYPGDFFYVQAGPPVLRDAQARPLWALTVPGIVSAPAQAGPQAYVFNMPGVFEQRERAWRDARVKVSVARLGVDARVSGAWLSALDDGLLIHHALQVAPGRLILLATRQTARSPGGQPGDPPEWRPPMSVQPQMRLISLQFSEVE